jgi:hypothetical protein
MLAYVAAFVALPHWLTATLLAVNVALFVYMAKDDEKDDCGQHARGRLLGVPRANGHVLPEVQFNNAW